MALGPTSASKSAAQVRGVTTVMELRGMRLAVSGEEMRALSEVGNLTRSSSPGPLDRALVTARRVARSRDARYALALYESEIAKRRGDQAMYAQALDFLIGSTLLPKAQLPGLLATRGQIAFQTGELDRADALWARYAELTPEEPDAWANLAQVKLARQDAEGALALISRAIQLREVARLKASESWYRQRLSITQQGRLGIAGVDAARELVEAYPSTANWRTALMVYRDLAAPAGPAEVDLFRLMRHAQLLSHTAEYQRMAQLLNLEGASHEARAVLDEGTARGLIDVRTSPTREIAAEIDRSIAKGNRQGTAAGAAVSPAADKVRVGFGHVQGGRLAEAEAEFRAAAAQAPTGERHAELARFWLAMLRHGVRTTS